MNVFLLTETQSGCYKWRAAIPAKYLSRRGHRIQVFDMTGSSRYEAPDVMVFYRAHFQEGIKIAEWCKRKGVRVIFDTDDALDLVPPENLNRKIVQSRLSFYEALLEMADAVTTTTPTLAEHLRHWNPNVVVVPNSVDPEEWTLRTRSGQVRIGWTGSATHFADLSVALDAVRELQKKRDFMFVLQGICLEPTLEEMHQNLLALHGKQFFETPVGHAIKHFLRRLAGVRYEFHPNVAVGQHAGKVCELSLDVGIAPLIDNPFNRHKSCIKFYEYAMAGAVTVASHVVPYSEEVSLTAKNNRDAWKRKLELVLEQNREAIWRQQRDWVLTHRNIETTVALWERVLAGSQPCETAPLQEALAKEAMPV